MDNRRKTWVMSSAMAVFVVGAAATCFWSCGSSNAGSNAFYCSLSVAGQQYCYAYLNLSSGNADSARSMCSGQGGTSVSSCPSSNLVGCCALTQSGVSYQSCYYYGTASSDEMVCSAANGNWTSGSSALPGNGSQAAGGASGSGGGSSGSGGNGGGSSTACTGNGICCPDSYCTLGGAHGYQFTYSDQNDGGGSSSELTQTSCVRGSTMGASCQSESSPQDCYSSHWGAGLGFNLNQSEGTSATAMSFTSASSSGITYAVDPMQSNMRLVVGDSTTDYCYNVTSASGTIPWSSFSSTCWNSTGTHLSGPPSNFVSVRFQIVADTSYGNDDTFSFCVTKLSL